MKKYVYNIEIKCTKCGTGITKDKNEYKRQQAWGKKTFLCKNCSIRSNHQI